MTDADALETRFGTARCARYLGITRRAVQSLIRSGALEAWDLRSPGSSRARWTVTEASVRKLLEARHRYWRTDGTGDRGGVQLVVARTQSVRGSHS